MSIQLGVEVTVESMEYCTDMFARHQSESRVVRWLEGGGSQVTQDIIEESSIWMPLN